MLRHFARFSSPTLARNSNFFIHKFTELSRMSRMSKMKRVWSAMDAMKSAPCPLGSLLTRATDEGNERPLFTMHLKWRFPLSRGRIGQKIPPRCNAFSLYQTSDFTLPFSNKYKLFASYLLIRTFSEQIIVQLQFSNKTSFSSRKCVPLLSILF